MRESKRVKDRFEIRNLDSKFYTELDRKFQEKNTGKHEQCDQE